VALVREGSQQVASRVISCPQDAVGILREAIGSSDREVFLTLLLNTRHRVIGIHPVSTGSLNASVVHPRETFKAAMLANAAAIILAHAHPSGDPEPSAEDLAITNRLREAGALLGIPVLDHLVIAETAFVSLQARGLL
jgi:DNA repair protein RadC